MCTQEDVVVILNYFRRVYLFTLRRLSEEYILEVCKIIFVYLIEIYDEY
jgi:hypothetical protein